MYRLEKTCLRYGKGLEFAIVKRDEGTTLYYSSRNIPIEVIAEIYVTQPELLNLSESTIKMTEELRNEILMQTI